MGRSGQAAEPSRDCIATRPRIRAKVRDWTMRSILTTMLVAVAAMSTGTAYAQQNEVAKLNASDAGDRDQFGHSVALDGDTVVIGTDVPTNGHDDDPGSAYVFTRSGSTWAEQAKLIASDGEPDNEFGCAVAIDGDTAVIGAQYDDFGNGSAYVFTRSGGTWTQQAKLQASDRGHTEYFGCSVSIDGDTVVIGASRGFDDEFNRKGCAYVFTRSGGVWTEQAKLFREFTPWQHTEEFGWAVSISGDTAVIGTPRAGTGPRLTTGVVCVFTRSGGVWTQQAELLPSDGAEDDRIGHSVSIDADTIVIGMDLGHGDDDGPGSAYVFTRSGGVWTQQAKLISSDGMAGDSFGRTVSVSGDTAVVGAYTDDDNGDASGSAFLFKRSSGVWTQQVATLLPRDANHSDHFGRSVSIEGETAVIGAPGDGYRNLQSAGSVFVFAFAPDTDTDGDGLLDDWEANGIPYTDSHGAKQRFLLPGADHMHKDLYIEVDAMQGLAPTQAALDLVVEAFANAPNDLVNNPDMQKGITVHFENGGVDEDDLQPSPWVDGWTEFDAMKLDHFGTSAEQNDAEWASIKEAKARAYRYCVFAAEFDGSGDGETDSTSGMGELPGNDFMVTLGHHSWQTFFQTSFGSQHKDKTMAGTFMHELGHTLGLRHGGGDQFTHKPNYHSVMNYTWQFPKEGFESSWVLNYSRRVFPSLNELSLQEPAGIGGHSGHTTQSGPLPWKLVPETGRVDWDRNGVDTDTGVIADINASGKFEVLDGFEDWSQLVFSSNVNWEPGVHQILLGSEADLVEMTWEMYDSMYDGCPVDLTSDGLVDTRDFVAFLNAWASGDLLADWDRNDIIDTRDFIAYLNDWVAGCP